MLLACSSAEPGPRSSEAASSGAGSGGEGGSPDPNGCEPGTKPLDDGSCMPAGAEAGIAPDDCPDGFVSDGELGCEPVLPRAACPPGELALPGDRDCHPIAPCGSGTWGDIPTEATTQYVDATYIAGDADGTTAKPWPTIGAALAAAQAGATIAVAAGSYSESVIIDKPVVVRGRCPDLVEIVGTVPAAVQLLADGAGLRGVAVIGTSVGVEIDAADAALDELWIHETGDRAVVVRGSAALRAVLIERPANDALLVSGSQVTVNDSAIRDGAKFGFIVFPNAMARSKLVAQRVVLERNTRVAVLVEDSDVTLRDCVVRATRQGPDDHGYGLHAQRGDTALARAQIDIDGCLFADNRAFGVNITGSGATIDRTVIRDTEPGSAELSGRGLQARYTTFDGSPSEVTARRTVLARNHNAGVAVASSTAELDRVVVRDTIPDVVPGLQSYGHGVTAFAMEEATSGASVVVTGSLIERNTEAGISGIGADISVDSTLIRQTASHPTNDYFGRGITVQDAASFGEPSRLDVRWSVLEENREVALVALGVTELSLEASVLRGTLPRPMAGSHGWGLSLHEDLQSQTAPIATVSRCLVDGNREAGVAVLGGELTLTDVIVRATQSDQSGGFGDGLILGLALRPNVVRMTGGAIRDNERAGIAVFQGEARVTGVDLDCNGIDLNVDSINGSQGELLDEGGNVCRCGQTAHACKVASSGLTPPQGP